jgi:two-component system, cell cycle sensor histidine kinase and response regulator CckA
VITVPLILVLSILLQVAAVVLALRLIPVTGNLKAWIWISAAISLMAVRRGVSLLHMPGFAGHHWSEGEMIAEVVALATSLFLLIGIASIAPLFRSIRQSRDALAAETERLAVTLRSIADGVIATDTRGCVVLMNHVAEQLTGWRQTEAAGRPFDEVFRTVDAETLQPLDNPAQQLLESGRPVSRAGSAVLVSREGVRRMIEESGAPIRSAGGEVYGVILVFRDITEKRQMERELLRAQKLESVGVLAGGIAHDFNNVLTAVVGNLGLAKSYTFPGSEIHERIEAAEKASECAEGLARQLLTFSRGGEPVKQPLVVQTLLRTASSIGLSGSNVKCELDVAEDTWPVDADEGQMQQVMNNLILNAAEAMSTGGTVTIRAENTVVARGRDEEVPLNPGRYVTVSVQDRGVGIPEEHLSKIFDPFFSTKRKGSGLGLAVVDSVVRKHGGHVGVSSKPGEGATFTLRLPAAKTRAEVPADTARKEDLPRKGVGRVLLMDDEAIVRAVAQEMLAHLGYEVVVAREGQEAVCRFGEALEDGRPFDLVILDLTVAGGMGGEEAVRRLREIDPRVKAVVSSGYNESPVMADFESYGFSGVIPKPYRLADLASRVQDVLNRGPGGGSREGTSPTGDGEQ